MSKLRQMTVAGLASLAADDDTLDNMNVAYRTEYDRWGWRRRLGKDGFELFRCVGLDETEITSLTKRECKDKHDAEIWYLSFAGRAAMKKALEAVR